MKCLVGRARSHGRVLQTVESETVFFLKSIFSRSDEVRKPNDGIWLGLRLNDVLKLELKQFYERGLTDLHLT